jgi:uncharacterized protein YqgQ
MKHKALSKIIGVIKNPKKIIIYLDYHGYLNWLNDKAYLKLVFYARMGKRLDLENPKTFNEKLQWLKLYNRKPEYTTMVDKYEAKNYVAEIIGEKYIIPTLGVWERFEDIPFDKLPSQFVLKCTHDSGGLVICKNREEFDIEEARKKIEHSLKTNYYLQGREWPYKNVKPRIIAEKYMQDIGTQDLKDYKFFCFGGKAKCFKVDFDRFIEHHANYYDVDKNLLDFGEASYPPDRKKKIDIRATELHEMEQLAEKLSKGIPFLRADFYDVNGNVYFGELTFYPASGFGEFTSTKWDEIMGEWIPIRGGALLINKDLAVVLKDSSGGLIDYKFYCFNGVPRYLYVSQGMDNHKTARVSFLTMDWERAFFGRDDYSEFEMIPPKPGRFEDMKQIAAVLSQGIDFLRVDLYEINGEVYFSELTFSPCCGFMPFNPPSADYDVGRLLEIK